VVVDPISTTLTGSVMTVAFPSPVALDGAAVTAIGTPPQTCGIPFSPWVAASLAATPAPQSATDAAARESELAYERNIPPVLAPAPVDEPVPCAKPYQLPTTQHAAQTTYPADEHAKGPAIVEIVLRPDDTIDGVRIEQSSGNPALDQTALASAARSTFAGETLRCAPVFGSYAFTVEFPK
jgi:TonB family protein